MKTNMRTLLLFFFLTVSLLVNAQPYSDAKGVFIVAPSLSFNDEIGPGYGLHFAGGGFLFRHFLAAGSIDLISFKNVSQVYVPLAANFVYSSARNDNKASLLVMAEPGIGVYNNDTNEGRQRVVKKGGFTFYGGLGVSLPFIHTADMILAAGYATYTFSTEAPIQGSRQYSGLNLRLGLKFR